MNSERYFVNRTEEASDGTLDGTVGTYTERGMLERGSYDSHILKSMREDPNLDLSIDDQTVVEEYFDRLDLDYKSELTAFASDMLPMNPSVQMSIAVPAYKEDSHIYNTLTQYAAMKDPSLFEVVIFENHPVDTSRDNTAAEVTRFCKDYPEMQIAHFYKTFSKKRIGRVRKYLTDVILERKRQAGRTDSTILVSNDADLEGINPDYTRLVSQAFSDDPHLDALRGNTDLPQEAFKRFPLMHATLRFADHYRTVLRSHVGGAALNGRNTAMRSGVYAAIGGYNEQATIGEDVEIGNFILHGRDGDTSRLRYLHTAWVKSNPRREIDTMFAGASISKQYDNFDENESVYDKPIDIPVHEGQDFSPEQFATEIQGLYEYYQRSIASHGGWVADEIFHKTFDRTMKFMRISYRIEDDKVVIEDLSQLLADLDAYREKNT